MRMFRISAFMIMFTLIVSLFVGKVTVLCSKERLNRERGDCYKKFKDLIIFSEVIKILQKSINHTQVKLLRPGGVYRLSP